MLIDIAIVNGFILFRQHQASFPDDESLKRPSDYSVGMLRHPPPPPPLPLLVQSFAGIFRC